MASYSFVENGIQKTLEEVPAEKVINAVPFYTRFWKTDADGTVTSEALGMDSADERLANNGAEAVWDEETRPVLRKNLNMKEALIRSGWRKSVPSKKR